jgi:hypothetical protein
MQSQRIHLPGKMGDMGGSIGNAFHRLQAYAHPHVKHVITQTLEQADEDASEDSEHNDPVVHIRRQAVRIQRGDQVDRITALLPQGGSCI